MPGITDHLERARHNERLFYELDHGRYGDWAVIVLFYAALQYIDAYLASQGEVDPGGHDVRNDLIRDTPAIRFLWPQYARLQSFSRNARYYTATFTRHEIDALRIGSYEPIKAGIETLLGPPHRG